MSGEKTKRNREGTVSKSRNAPERAEAKGQKTNARASASCRSIRALCGLDTRRALVVRWMSRRDCRSHIPACTCRRGSVHFQTIQPEWEGASAEPCAAAVQWSADRRCSEALVRRGAATLASACRRGAEADPSWPVAGRHHQAVASPNWTVGTARVVAATATGLCRRNLPRALAGG